MTWRTREVHGGSAWLDNLLLGASHGFDESEPLWVEEVLPEAQMPSDARAGARFPV